VSARLLSRRPAFSVPSRLPSKRRRTIALSFQRLPHYFPRNPFPASATLWAIRSSVPISPLVYAEPGRSATSHSPLSSAAPPLSLLRPQPPIESKRFPTNPDTPPGVGVSTFQHSDVQTVRTHYFARNPSRISGLRTKSNTHRGWGCFGLTTSAVLRRSDVPTLQRSDGPYLPPSPSSSGCTSSLPLVFLAMR
jgi:hypothetical protein